MNLIFLTGALEKKGQCRKIRVKCYTYGFNGKERDNSFGNVHYDYGFRIYNPSIGKFLSVDPLTKEYPMLTPYQFASNMPIACIDLDGLEAHMATIWRANEHALLREKGYSIEQIDIIHKRADALATLTGAGLMVSSLFGGAVLMEVQALWAAPGAYLFNLFSDPAKVETTLEIATDIFAPDGAPLSPTSIAPDVSQMGDVASYVKNSKKAVVGDALTPDHIPSFAAIQKALENLTNAPLSIAQQRKLRRETTTLVISEEMHRRFSRTFGGRNGNFIEADALDLRSAAQQDLDALRPHLKDEGFSDEGINEIFNNVHENNEKVLGELGLDY